MKKILFYYSFSFAFGGGDHLPLSFIAALQQMGDLTVALDVPANLERASKLFGIDVDLSGLKIVQVTPPGYAPRQHSIFSSLYRSRRLKQLAKAADVCISAANVIDFGRPAHHFMNMLAFGDDAFTAFAHSRVGQSGTARHGGVGRLLKDYMLRPLLGIRSQRSIIRDGREHIYPNSVFVEKLMTEFYGPFNSTVFYPPTLFEARASAVVRDPLKVIYIGRIIPEKRIVEIIDIVEKTRAATGLDVRLHVAGRMDQVPSYGEQLRGMGAGREWLKFEGALYEREKEDFLLSGSFALHAERFEAFGISIGEYLKTGSIAVVPDEGGAKEVVASPELTFHTVDEAVAILARLLTDAAFRERQRRHCAERALFFSREAYLERQQRLLEGIVCP